jgi:hypothetical protein
MLLQQQSFLYSLTDWPVTFNTRMGTVSEVELTTAFANNNENVFANDKWDVGRTDIVTHKIDTQHADPIRQEPRRLPFGQRSELTTQIDKMLKQDIIF